MPAAHDFALIRSDIDLRTASIVEALRPLDDAALAAPSALPDWNRLTIVCHLRYGAQALRSMTEAVRSGRPTSFYPEGRAHQRPHTLHPGPEESPRDVIASLARCGETLSQLWSTFRDDEWELRLKEPVNNPDLGPVTLGRLALLRLTEVQVHGPDLDLGLGDWSPRFIELALPMRLDGLKARQVGPHGGGAELEGSWLFRAEEGPTTLITVSKGAVDVSPARPTSPARATVEATSRDLLALLLGRPCLQPPRITGDVAFGQAFSVAFPGP
jgi:uncharacterized protein (TIGR03083 family)